MKEVDWSCTKTGNIDFDTVTCEKCCFDCINLKEHQIVESTFTECTIKDGNFENIWEELWQLRGKKVVVEGHRSRNVEDYDHVFITSIKIIK